MTPETVEAGREVDQEEGVDDARSSLTELAEGLARDIGALLQRETELNAARNSPALRRTARTVAVWSVVAVAFATAFALGNWAAVRALDNVLPAWAAPLVLAAAWVVLGAALIAAMTLRSGEPAGVGWRRVLAGGDDVVTDCERARDEAQDTVRSTLAEFAEAVAAEAEARIAAAVVPIAGGIAEAGENILEASEELVEDIVDGLPGGSLVNQAVDLVLLPGRWSLRVATTALKGTPDAK